MSKCFCIFNNLFFLGSFPSAHIVSSIQGVDIKKTGSGNAGATNVLRSVGWKSGLIVMILDIAKGIAPFYLSLFFYWRHTFEC